LHEIEVARLQARVLAVARLDVGDMLTVGVVGLIRREIPVDAE
jgi:hypothetical protein